MSQLINKIHCCDNLEGMKSVQPQSVDLIISDPPYYKIKGEFDFVFSDFTEYLSMIEEQAKAYKRLLKDNGTILIYGHALKIAYIQIVFDKYFKLENHIVWHKIDCQNNRQDFTAARRFAPVKEHLLMYSNFANVENPNVFYEGFEPIRQYLRNEVKRVGVKTIAQHLNVTTRAIGHWTSKCQWTFPSDANIEKCRELGMFQTEEVGYDKIKAEYLQKRRYFNNERQLSDVMRFSQQSHITKRHEHETKKPENLTTALLLSCSRPNDLVLVPFAGSGTECAIAARHNRKFIGFEIEERYATAANKRVQNELKQLKIFAV